MFFFPKCWVFVRSTETTAETPRNPRKPPSKTLSKTHFPWMTSVARTVLRGLSSQHRAHRLLTPMCDPSPLPGTFSSQISSRKVRYGITSSEYVDIPRINRRKSSREEPVAVLLEQSWKEKRWVQSETCQFVYYRRKSSRAEPLTVSLKESWKRKKMSAVWDLSMR